MGLDKEDIKQLIAILQRGLVDDISVEHTQDDKPSLQKTRKRTTTKSKKNKPSKPVRENKFVDMPEMNMHKDDCLFDQKVIVSPPTPRRSPFRPISVRCRICGKTETVDPSIIEASDRHKCNKCSSSAG
jgi:hypothetical protein